MKWEGTRWSDIREISAAHGPETWVGGMEAIAGRPRTTWIITGYPGERADRGPGRATRRIDYLDPRGVTSQEEVKI